jgi:quercetin dioxygenase-like cupin family protein
MLLFTFESGGRLPEHRAPGQVVIHCLGGELAVEAGATRHRLSSGEVLVLEPDVPHSVEALADSDMLLTVCLG